MQDNEYGSSPEAATTAAGAALQDGRTADARALATAALREHGPDPVLSTLLGRAHAVENDDDHDDEAEQAYRQGLADFPDDLGLLTAYAELCLESDALDRPGRHSRGPELTARVSELAPGSPQALHLDRVGRGLDGIRAASGGSGSSPASPIPLSAAHAQRHDVRTAVATAPDLAEATRLAEEDAQRYPYDLRRTIRAETLTALGRPGRRLLLAHLRAPLLSVPIALALGALTLIPWTASPLSLWAAASAAIMVAPNRLLGVLENRARRRGLARLLPPPADVEPSYSPLPPPPAPGARDFAVVGAAVVLGLFAMISPSWFMTPAPAVHTDYPHYTASAPATFLGEPLLSALPAVDGVDPSVAEIWRPSGDGSFSYVYGTAEEIGERMAEHGFQPAAIIFGATGDFHGTGTSAIRSYERRITESDATIDATWDAPSSLRPGGTLMHCFSYTTDEKEKAGTHVACTWADSGSSGTVDLNGSGLDHSRSIATTLMARDAVLHEKESGPSGNAEASSRHRSLRN
ncbi:hypothetical protein ACGFR8_14380 [Streptomyces brevispora]|uniref:hypothetical protein n=1 Tax=Streptomyces brevispora TaxID=887462 RepID=UPI003720C0A9